MGIAVRLAAIALREVAGSAGEAVGFKIGGIAVSATVDFLIQRFTDQSRRLSDSLERANGRAWQAVEIALAGDSFWDRCKVALTRGEDQAFRRQVRAFLDITPLAGLPNHGPEFRQQCLREIRAARAAGLLTDGNLAPDELARQAGAFAAFTDPQALLDAESQAVAGLAEDFRAAGYPAVAQLLSLRPAQGMPLLVVAARYFFRREVETNQQLFQGLAWAKLERLDQAQESGFTALAVAFATQGQRLEEMLGDVRAIVEETHGSVLRIEEEVRRHGRQVQELGDAVLRLLEQHQLQRRSLQPRDSLSIRGEDERRLVRQLVGRYRALPEDERRQMPGLLNGVGKLEVLAGDFAAAQHDFEAAAALAPAPTAKAEAHYHAYRAALEQRDWSSALRELRAAVEDDSARFLLFPLDKYQPERILGAGGFGVAFLCRHAFMNAPVVVKTLTCDGLDQSLEKVFTEAQLLRQLDHPAIIRVSDCGYADAAQKHPYLVMDYFEGPTLEEHVRQQGRLWPNDFRQVARQVADGLRAAHSRGILHRDVKPANLLVRREDAGWKVKLIDFGLAQRSAGTAAGSYQKTLAGQSIAGTIDYAAPEQLGKLPGVAVGPAADVYAFGRLCCYALFQTPHPLSKQLRHIDPALVDLLENCMAESPPARPADFTAVLDALEKLDEQPVDVLPIEMPVKHPTLPATAPPTIAKAPPPRCEPPAKAAPTIAKPPPPKRAPAPDVLPRRRILSARALVIGIAGFTLTLAVGISWFKWSSSESHAPSQARVQPRIVKEVPIPQDSVALPTTQASKKADVVPKATTPSPTLPNTKPRRVVSSPVGPEGKTGILGGLSNPIFEDLAPEGGLLIGLEVGLGKIVSNEIVRAIRPIYRTAKEEVRGKQYGTKLDRVISLKAKEGYAVGSVTATAGLTVHGLSIRFVRVKGGSLDSNDSYETPWHGSKRSPFDTKLGDDLTPIIGIVGRTDKEDCTGLGLILRAKTPDKATDTVTPPESKPGPKIRILVVSRKGDWTSAQWDQIAPLVRDLADSPDGGMVKVEHAGSTTRVDIWPVRDPKICMRRVTFGTIGGDYGKSGFLIHVDPAPEKLIHLQVVSQRGPWKAGEWELVVSKIRALADGPHPCLAKVAEAGNTKKVDIWPVGDPDACMKKVTFGTVTAKPGKKSFTIQVDPAKLRPDPINPAELQGIGISDDWQPIFCSGDPRIWNTNVKEGASHFARPLTDVSEDIRYLRLRKDRDYVILPMTRKQLQMESDDGRVGWIAKPGAAGVMHLGIFDSTKECVSYDVRIRPMPARSGWGFGPIQSRNNELGYSWDGLPIPPAVFEVAVKKGPLTDAESKKLLTKQMASSPAAPSSQKIRIHVVSSRRGDLTGAEWDQVAPLIRALADSPDGGMIQAAGFSWGKYVDLWPVRDPKICMRGVTFGKITEDHGKNGFQIRVDPAPERFVHLQIVSKRGPWKPGEWELLMPKLRGLADPPEGCFAKVAEAGNTIKIDLWPVHDPDACMKKVTFGTVTAKPGKKSFTIQIDPAKLRPDPINPSELQGIGISDDWQPIFCSADPRIWNTDVKEDSSHFARPLTAVAEDIRYLRLRKDRDYVIIAMRRKELQTNSKDGRFGWISKTGASGAMYLGIYDSTKECQRHDVCVCPNLARTGWGFGPIQYRNNGPGYCWDGQPILPAVIEIAVKAGPLTEAESKKLLSDQKK